VTASYHKGTAGENADDAKAASVDTVNTKIEATTDTRAPTDTPSVSETQSKGDEQATSTQPQDTGHGTEATSKPPPSSSSGPRLPAKSAKKKIGTLHQEEKWSNYAGANPTSLQAHRKNSFNSGLLKVTTLSNVERMSVAVPVSRPLRLVLVSLLTVILCLIKEGDLLAKDENSSMVFNASESHMVDSCSALLTSANIFQASTVREIPAMARSCLANSRVVIAMVLATEPRFAWATGIQRPIAYVGLASVAAAVFVFLASYVFPRILVKHLGGEDDVGSDGGPAAMVKKMMSTMLPANLRTAFHSVNLLRTMLNAVFMDASCYLVIMITYQLVVL